MARTVSVKLMADASQYKRELLGAAKSTREFSGGMEKAARAGKLDMVTQQAAGLGLGLVGVAGAVTKMAMDFDKQMSAVQAATHASGKEMDRLRQAALDAGADTKFSATEAAKGVEELAKAGVSSADILGGGLKGALDLAAAGGLDVGEAAETAASAMTQFNLKGGQTPHIADLLAAAAGKAQGSVHDMGAALNQSGLVASQMGLSIEDTTGTLAAFASAGLMGSDAGTSFKTMLLQLANPTGKSRDLMQELGISAYDAQGAFVGVTNLAGQLQTKLAGLSQEQRDAAMAQIFGTDAIRAANVLYKQGAQGIQGWIDKTDDAGYAAETARIKTDNLAGDIERLTGSLQTLAIESGSGTNSGLRVLTKSVGALVDEFSSLPSGIGATITVMAGLGGAALLAGAGWVTMRRRTAEMLTELRDVGPTGVRAANGLERASKYAGRAAAAFAVFEIASAAVSAAQKDLNPQVEAMAAGLTKYGQGAALSGEASRVLGADLKDLDVGFKFLADTDSSRSGFVRWGQGLLETVVPGLDGTNTSLTKTRERVTAMDAALAQLVSGGSTTQAAASFNRIAAALAKDGVSLAEVRAQFPQYAAALETAGSSSKNLTGAATGTAGAIDGVGKQAEETAEQVKELDDRFNALFGAQMSVDRANIKYQQGLIDVQKELRKGTRTLALNSVEGRKNRTAVLDQLDAIQDLRQARIAHGESLDQANGKYRRDVTGLRNSMRQAGFTKKEIDKLTRSYDELPNTANTKVSVTGLKQVFEKLGPLTRLQTALMKGSSSAANSALNAYNKAKGLADGGPVPGISPNKRADNIPAMLTADEHVWTVDEVNAAGGHAAVERMRRMALAGKLRGYAGGGRVTWPFPMDVSRTRIPSPSEVRNAVTPPAPTGGRTDDWIVRTVRAAFPGLDWISKYRPGSTTLSGNRSYHSMHRAVDWPASHALAVWWNQHYKAQTKELISPWNELNIHNGRRHTYTGAVYRQHNFAGGNAHDHIAMAGGGEIREPVVGVGASGTTYSFGERGTETVIPGSYPPYSPAAGGASQAVAAADLARAVAAALRGVNVVMDGRVVGQIQGRDANLLARTG